MVPPAPARKRRRENDPALGCAVIRYVVLCRRSGLIRWAPWSWWREGTFVEKRLTHGDRLEQGAHLILALHCLGCQVVERGRIRDPQVSTECVGEKM